MKRFFNQLFRQFMWLLLLVLLTGIYSLMAIPLVTDAKSRSLKQSVPLAGFSNITLLSGSTNTNIDRTVNGSDVTYAPNADSASIGVDNMVTDLGNNLNVIITTTSTGTGTEDGDITMNTNVGISWATAAALTMSANRQIVAGSGASISATGGGAITLNANQGITPTSGDFKGIELDNATIESATGSIALNGRGGDASDSQYGILIQNGTIIRSTGTGTITLNGTGGNGTHSNYGLHITGIAPQVTTIDGDLQMTGQGGNGSQSNNHGIYINNGTVSTDNGHIDLTGEGGDGTGTDFGIWLQGGGTQILSVDGDIQLIGTGGDGTGNSKDGLEVRSAIVRSTGAGNVTVLVNTGGVGQNAALRMYYGGIIQVKDGNLAVTATSNGHNGQGLYSPPNHSPSLVSTGAGQISITATGTGSGPDISFEGNGALGGASATGDIAINADTVKLDSTLSIHSTGNLTIQPRNASTTIGLGGGMGTLNLDDDELSAFQDGFASMIIGDALGGTGDVDIDSATFLDPVTIAGGTIKDNAGTDITAPSVTLDGNVAPGQSPGQLVVSGDLSFSSPQTLTLELDGPTAGTEFDQVDVTGVVNLNNIVLTGTLGFTPTTGDAFIIIDNDGTDAVNGTFNGLAEGGKITIGDYEFTVTYVGGTGNDVVLLNATSLAVALAIFETKADNESILIRWQTVSERDNLGFNLYRATQLAGEQLKLNSELIPAQAPGSGQGAAYEWLDTNVYMGSTYFYWLEDVDVNGTTTMHGPISATANQTTAVMIGDLSSAVRSELPIVASLMLMLVIGWLLRRR